MHSLETIIALNAKRQAEYDAKLDKLASTPKRDFTLPLTAQDKDFLQALKISVDSPARD